MSKPSQIFLMVEMVVLLFLPLVMLLKVDWVIPLMVASLLIVMDFSLQSSKIRSFTASPMFKPITSIRV